MRRPPDPRLLAVVLCALWGTQFIVQRLALEDAPPMWVGAGRTTVAALVLVPLAARLRAFGRRRRLTASARGVSTQTAFVGLQVAGLRPGTAGPAAAIVY